MNQPTAADKIKALLDSLTLANHFELFCALENLHRETLKNDEFWMGWYLGAVQNRQDGVEAERRQQVGATVLEIGKAVQAQIDDNNAARKAAEDSRQAAKSRWFAETVKCCRYKGNAGRNGKACVEIDTNQYCVSCSARS